MLFSNKERSASPESDKVQQLFHHLKIHQADRREARSVLRPFRRTLRAESAIAASATHTAADPSSLSPQGTAPPCYAFYSGRTPQGQPRASIEELLMLGGEASSSSNTWQPEVLERKHDYIQWIFPLRTRGMNWAAPLLTTRDVALLRADGTAFTRVLRALQMMFRFYGCSLTFMRVAASEGSASPTDTARVHISRSANALEQTAQYRNLLGHFHNCLRITRMLQFMAELQLGRVQEGWMEFLFLEVFAEEAVVNEDDDASIPVQPTTAPPPLRPLRRSYLTFWLESLPSTALRRRLLDRAAQIVLGEPQVLSARKREVWVEQVQLPQGTDLSQLGLDPSMRGMELTPPAARKRARSV